MSAPLRSPEASRRGLWLSRFHGFVDVVLDAINGFMNNGDANQAAAIALYAFLSIIPLFILSVLAAGRFLGTESHQGQLVGVLESFHPGFSGKLMGQLGQIDEKRGMLGWIGIGTLIWLSSLIFGAIETALNSTFRSRIQRNYFHSKALAIAMIPLGWAIATTSIVLTAFASILHQSTLVRFIIPCAISVILLTAIYRITPTRKLPMKILLTGSLIFSAFMEPVKQVFTWYVAHHTRYNQIFGSLETVVILVIWVFYVALLFLFCAEIMSSYERRDFILIEKALLGGDHNRNVRLFLKFGRPFPAGSLVFQEGSLDKDMYFILAGRIRLEKKAGQVRKTLAELGPGEYFGEMAALADAPRGATAVASVDSELAVISEEVFRHLLRESEEVALRMLKEFSARMRNTNAALDELTQSWMHVVILMHLLGRSPKPLSSEALAHFTGHSESDVREVLQHFEDQSVLTLKNGEVATFNPDRAWAFLAAFSRTSEDAAREPVITRE